MHEFFFGSGTGHSLMVLTIVIGIGLLLGKIKIKNLSMGPVWILFAGIAVSAAGVSTDSLFRHFMKELGLVLFIFSVGMQMGPGFFSSFKGKGLKLNLLSTIMIAVTIILAVLVYVFGGCDAPQMAGIFAGSATNTPAMGTAQQTCYDIVYGSFLKEVQLPHMASNITGAFSVSYPVGILCTLLCIFLFRKMFRSGSTGTDNNEIDNRIEALRATVTNPSAIGMKISALSDMFHEEFVLTSIIRNGSSIPVTDDPELEKGDELIIEVEHKHIHTIELIFGHISLRKVSVVPPSGNLTKGIITITKSSLTGKRLEELDLLGGCGVTVRKVNRSGVNLIARKDLQLQMGDVLSVIGTDGDIKKAAALVGNSNTELERPNLIPIFLGIGLGVMLGAVPISLPGVPHPVRFGLAGGCLVVSILLGHFGPKMHITTYTTSSAGRMIREIGLCLLLGAIGLSAGEDFGSLFSTDGLRWIGFAALLSTVPAIVTGLLARYAFKLGFSEICGLITGSATNPEVLAASELNYGDEKMAESYATVYPVSMFLRVMAAEVMILAAMA